MRVDVFFYDGFEEMEGVVAVDILRRAQLEVQTVSLNETLDVRSAHGVHFRADAGREIFEGNLPDAIVLPGGDVSLPLQDAQLHAWLRAQDSRKKPIAAICAAPKILATAGILKGHPYTCYPGCEGDIGGEHLAQRVVRSGHITTAVGPSAALEFALSLAETLSGREMADRVRRAILAP